MRVRSLPAYAGPTLFSFLVFYQLEHLELTTTVLRWSMGSLLFLMSWGVLMGPVTYSKHANFALFVYPLADANAWPLVQHLISGPRLPFTAAYFGSITLTLWFSLGVSCSLYSLHASPLSCVHPARTLLPLPLPHASTMVSIARGY
jgi:hypothetical protein